MRARIFELAATPAESEQAEATPACSEGEAGASTSGEAEGVDSAATDAEVARWLTRFDEFYTSGGCHDLLFHPQETAFTLRELDGMLRAASLVPVGVFFASLEQDFRTEHETPAVC